MEKYMDTEAINAALAETGAYLYNGDFVADILWAFGLPIASRVCNFCADCINLFECNDDE